jgi:uncharacterized membrane protein YgcG
MTSKKSNYLFLLTFIILFSTANFSFAQEGAGEDGPIINYTDTSSESNIYLDQPVVSAPVQNSPAQKSNGKLAGVYNGSELSCPYAFERDLGIGTKGQDVKLLQVLLNSDKRTMIAVSGTGSQGQETTLFGPATKDAIKRFQALFIEYVGVANGRFGPKTRTVMNAICNGENRPSTNSATNEQGGKVFTNVVSVQKDASPTGVVTNVVNNNSNDKIPPRVSLSANLNTVEAGTTFKVVVNASEEIAKFTAESVIIDGGTVKEVRKLSKVSYSISVVPNEGVKNVMIQIEAEKINDLAGNTNEDASNEINVKVAGSVVAGTATATPTQPADLTSLLDKIVASAPNCTYSSAGTLVTSDSMGKSLNTTGCPSTQTSATPQTYTCNGQQIPNTQPCNNNQNNQTQTVCTTQPNPFTGQPQQVCQQMSAQQAAQQQQAAQNKGLGQMLGQLLGKNGFGGMGGGSGSGGGGSGGGGGGGSSVPQQPPAAPKTEAEKKADEKMYLEGQCGMGDDSACDKLKTTGNSTSSGCGGLKTDAAIQECTDRELSEKAKALEKCKAEQTADPTATVTCVGDTKLDTETPESAKVVKDYTEKCNYIYNDIGSDYRDPIISDNVGYGIGSKTSTFLSKKMNKDTYFMTFGDYSYNDTGVVTVNSCSVFDKKELKPLPEYKNPYCCSNKRTKSDTKCKDRLSLQTNGGQPLYKIVGKIPFVEKCDKTN